MRSETRHPLATIELTALLALWFFLFAQVANSQERDEFVPPAKSVDLGVVEFRAPSTEVSLSVGDVPLMLQTAFSATIKNPSNVPLQIQKVEVGCGCLAAVPSAKVIPASGEGKVFLMFRPTTLGTTSRTISVYFAEGKSLAIKIDSTVKPVFAVSPRLYDIEKGETLVEFEIRENFANLSPLREVQVHNDLVVVSSFVSGAKSTLALDVTKFMDSFDARLPLKLTLIDESLRVQDFQVLLRRSDRVEVTPSELHERHRGGNAFTARAYLVGSEKLISQLTADEGLSCKVECDDVANLTTEIIPVKRLGEKALVVEFAVGHDVTEPKTASAKWLDVNGEEVAKVAIRLARHR